MSWFDWLLIGILGILFFLALRHIIRQAKKGRCCGCSGCSNCGGRFGCGDCSGGGDCGNHPARSNTEDAPPEEKKPRR